MIELKCGSHPSTQVQFYPRLNVRSVPVSWEGRKFRGLWVLSESISKAF
jgi:hypothetical protein